MNKSAMPIKETHMRHEYYQTTQAALIPFSMASRRYYTDAEVMRGYKKDAINYDTPEQYIKKLRIFRIQEGNNVYRQEIDKLEKLATIDLVKS